ncbi:hypothetical protein WN943_022619 [Citrus x changshan-huyou]
MAIVMMFCISAAKRIDSFGETHIRADCGSFSLIDALTYATIDFSNMYSIGDCAQVAGPPSASPESHRTTVGHCRKVAGITDGPRRKVVGPLSFTGKLPDFAGPPPPATGPLLRRRLNSSGKSIACLRPRSRVRVSLEENELKPHKTQNTSPTATTTTISLPQEHSSRPSGSRFHAHGAHASQEVKHCLHGSQSQSLLNTVLLRVREICAPCCRICPSSKQSGNYCMCNSIPVPDLSFPF